MKLFVVLALIAVAAAAPQVRDEDAEITRYDNNNGIDYYNFAWESSNRQSHQEQGQLRNAGTDNEVLSVQGEYSWVGPDSVTYLVKYTADENGFQPTIEQGPGGAVPPGVIASLLG